MPARRKFWLGVFCVLSALMLLGQVTLCLAEHAGLVTCAEHQQESVSPSPAEAPSDCSFHGTCLGNFVVWGGTELIPHQPSGSEFLLTTPFVPEAPVREIDHPPQLS